MELLCRRRKGPVFDECEFGNGWKIPCWSEIVTQPFDSILEIFAFLEFETHAILNEGACNAIEKREKVSDVSAPQEDIVDDVLVAIADGGWNTFRCEFVPVFTKDRHNCGVHGRTVHWAERKNGVGIFAAVGAPESKLFLRLRIDSYLVKSLHGVESHEPDRSLSFCETFKSVEASWDWEEVRTGDGIEWSVIDAHSPNVLINVVDVFLVRFRGEYQRGSPWSVFLANQSVVFQIFQKFEHNRSFVSAVVRLS